MEYYYKLPMDYKIDYRSEMVKFCLWEKINLNGTSTVSINYIRDRCGYSSDNRNKNSFSCYVRNVLKDLIQGSQIVQAYGEDVLTATSTSYLEFEILDNFYEMQTKAYAKLTSSVFNTLMSINCNLSKAVLLEVYAYMRSHIIENSQQVYGFCSGLDKTIVRELGFNRKTVDTCLNAFVESGLFIRYITGSYYANGSPKNAPNIYVLPDENAQINIQSLLEQMKQRYKVDEFAETLIPNLKNKSKK